MAKKKLEVAFTGDASSARAATREIVSGAEDAGKAVDGLGEKFKGLAGLVGGLAIGATLKAGFDNMVGSEMSNDKLAAQLGLPPKEAERMGKVAGGLYANAYGESLGEVNDAIRGIRNNGLVMEDATKKQISGVAANALDMVAIFEQDMPRVTAAAGTLVRNGMAKDAGEAFDILTRGFQQGADKGEDLLDTFIEYPSVLKGLGLSGAEATGLLVQGLGAGARNADVVADALKEFQIRAQDGSKLTAEGFKLLGIDAEAASLSMAAGGESAKLTLKYTLDALREIEDPLERNAAGVALFGTKWEDMGTSLLALDVDTAAGRLGKIEGAADKAGTAVADNLGTKLETWKRKGLAGLTSGIEGFLGGLSSVYNLITGNKAVLAGFVTFVGVALVGALWALAPAGFIAAAGLWAAVAPMLVAAAPVIAIGLAIGGLVALLTALGVDWGAVWDGIKAKAIEIWTAIQPTLSAIGSAIRDGVGAAVAWLKEAWSDAWPHIQSTLETAWSILGPILDTLGNVYMAYVSGGIAVVKRVAEEAWPIVSGAISGAWTIVEPILGFLWEAIQKVAGVIGWLIDTGGTVFDGFKGAVGTMWEAVRGPLNDLWSVLLGIYNAAKNAVEWAGKAADKAKDVSGLGRDSEGNRQAGLHGEGRPWWQDPIGAIAGNYTGGPTSGRKSEASWQPVHGGEYTLSADIVDAIKRGAPSRGLPALEASSSSGGGGDVIVILAGSSAEVLEHVPPGARPQVARFLNGRV